MASGITYSGVVNIRAVLPPGVLIIILISPVAPLWWWGDDRERTGGGREERVGNRERVGEEEG